ncbi:MAG TPA: hypothetical protein V6D11_14945 [Waterburya sp.]|jgi:hypothetical protein
MVRQTKTNPSTNQPPPGKSNEEQTSLGGRIRDGLSHMGKDFPNGMEPKGNGWYGSPDVIDPHDCDNYPESIYCGGNPVSKPKSPVGFDFDWGVNECGAYASVKGEVAGFSLPTHSRAWIRPECRDDYERQERDRKNPPPSPPPDWSKGRPDPNRQYRPHGFSANDDVVVVTCDSYYIELQQYYEEIESWGVAVGASHGNATEILYPTELLVNSYLPQNPSPVTARCEAKGKYLQTFFSNSAWEWNNLGQHDNYKEFPPEPRRVVQNGDIHLWIEPDRPLGDQFLSGENKRFQKVLNFPTGQAFNELLSLYIGKFGDIFPNHQVSPVIFQQGTSTDALGRETGRSIELLNREIVFCQKLNKETQPKRPHYDSPPPPDKDCCMQCCSNQGQNDQNDMLARLLKELKDIKKCIGFEEYPVPVPAHFNRELKEDGSKVDPPMIQIKNLTQLQGWQMKVLDGILGQWEVGFEVRDTDPEKEGDQPGRIIAPNVAELLSEMYAHIFDMWLLQYQQTHLMQRHSVETMLGKKVSVQNNYLLDAIADYLGFKREEKTQKIPFSLNIDTERFEDFMKNSEKEIMIQEYKHDPKKNPSFRDEALIQRMAASIIQSVHTRKFNPKSNDLAGDIRKQIEKINENTDRVNKDSYKSGSSDFEQWLEEAENAFIVRDPANPDPTQPYGLPLKQRPRLKRVDGHDTSDDK